MTEDKLNPPYFDEEERDLIEAYKRGEFVPVENQDEMLAMLKETACNYTRKDARVNIRLSSSDLTMLKIRAAEEGMPYQTLIASVLHKYVAGRLSG